MNNKLKEWIVGYILFAIPMVLLVYGEIFYDWTSIVGTFGWPLVLLGIHFLINKICGLK